TVELVAAKCLEAEMIFAIADRGRRQAIDQQVIGDPGIVDLGSRLAGVEACVPPTVIAGCRGTQGEGECSQGCTHPKCSGNFHLISPRETLAFRPTESF